MGLASHLTGEAQKAHRRIFKIHQAIDALPDSPEKQILAYRFATLHRQVDNLREYLEGELELYSLLDLETQTAQASYSGGNDKPPRQPEPPEGEEEDFEP